jgi:mono/diheme cytochrome c family protein
MTSFPRMKSFVILLVTAVFTGCKFKPGHNLEEQPSAHPAFKPSSAFADGTTARPVPYGTVPRAPADSPGFAYADVRELLPAMSSSAAETDVVPFPITRDLLLRGQERFRIYCSVCHGRLGDGGGMIVQRGLTPPPSFHIDRLRQVSDGHIYNVISNGYGQMFSYNDRVGPEDRWMIVAYIRALQAATTGQNLTAKLSTEERRTLQGSRP